MTVALVSFSGCGSIVEQSYRPAPAPSVALQPYSGSSRVYGSIDLEDDGRKLAQDGYVQLGTSVFRPAGHVTFEELQAAASQVGADVVLFRKRSPDSSQTLAPSLTDPQGNPSTLAPYVHISGSSMPGVPGDSAFSNSVGGGMFDFKGTVTASGIPGISAEEMAAINETRYEYTVTYWRKARGH